MCLVLLAVEPHPEVPLVVLANRDELYARPTARAARWADAPHVLAGRDLDKGGTWVGVAPGGRFAAVTNVRHPTARRDGASRGALVADYLRGSSTAERYASELDRDRYPAFNLLLRDETGVYYATEEGRFERVAPGVHGLSNARLDDPWPKVARGVEELAALTAHLPESLDADAAFGLLGDRRGAPDEELPRTGVPEDLERALAAPFIVLPGYGTRAQSVVVVRRSGDRESAELIERGFGEGGAPLGEVRGRL